MVLNGGNLKRIFAVFVSILMAASGVTPANAAGEAITLLPTTGTSYSAVAGTSLSLTATVGMSISGQSYGGLKFRVTNSQSLEISTNLVFTGSSTDGDVTGSTSNSIEVGSTSPSIGNAAYTSNSANLGITAGSAGSVSVFAWVDLDSDGVVDVNEQMSATRYLTFTEPEIPSLDGQIELTPSVGSTYAQFSELAFTLRASLSVNISQARRGKLKFLVANPNNTSVSTDLTQTGSTSDSDVSNSTNASIVSGTTASSGGSSSYTSAQADLSITVPGSAATSITVRAWIDDDQDSVIDVSEYVSPQRVITFVPLGNVTFDLSFPEIASTATSLTARLATQNSINLAQAAGQVKFRYAIRSAGLFTLIGNSSGESAAFQSSDNSLNGEISRSPLIGETYRVDFLFAGASLGYHVANCVAAGSQVSGTLSEIGVTPIANADVSIRSTGSTASRYQSTRTDSKGKFVFTNVPSGTYDLYHGKTGVKVYIYKAIQVDGSSALVANLAMPRSTGPSISGTVTDNASTPNAINGITLTTYYRGEIVLGQGTVTAYYVATTDSAGQYVLPNLPAGSNGLMLQVPSSGTRYFPAAPRTIEIGNSGITQNYSLAPYETGSASISGTVRNDVGEVVSSESLRIICVNSNALEQEYEIKVASSGSYSLAGLPSSSACSVNAYGSGAYLQSMGQAFALVSGASVTVNKTLVRRGASTVIGHVYSQADRETPIAGVPLSLTQTGDNEWGQTTTSDANGTFSFSDVPLSAAGKITLETKIIDTWGDEIPVDEVPYFDMPNGVEVVVSVLGSTVTVDIYLEPFPVGNLVLSGSVKNRLTNSAISGANLTIFYTLTDGQRRQSVSQTVSSNAQGLYSIAGIGVEKNESIHFTVRKTGYKAEHYWINVNSGETSRVRNVTLLPSSVGSGVYSGVVLDENNDPVPGANIYIQNLTYYDSEETTTDENGEFTFTGLREGVYTVQTSKYVFFGGYQRQLYEYQYSTVSIETSSSQLTNQTISVETTAAGSTTVRGKLINAATGAPIAGVGIQLHGAGGSTYEAVEIVTGSDGVWEMTEVPAGNYTLQYWIPSDTGEFINPPQQTFTVSNEDLIQLSTDEAAPLVPTGSSLSITVRDKNTKQPVAGANVTIWANNSNSVQYSAVADSKGRALFTNLPRADYNLMAWTQTSLPDGSSSISIRGGSQSSATLYLRNLNQTGTISGYIRNASGQGIPNVEVSAGFSIMFGCCSGDGYGSASTTDQNGFYLLEGVPMNQDLDFAANSDSRDNLGLAPINRKIKLSTANANVSDYNFTMRAGAKVSGTMINASGKIPNQIALETVDSTSGTLTAWGFLDVQGKFTVTDIPAGTVNIRIYNHSWPEPSDKPAGGYIKQTGSTYSIVASSSEATDFSLTAGQTINLGQLVLRTGGTISGSVSMKIGRTVSNQLPRDFRVIPWVKNGSDWQSLEAQNWHLAAANQYGAFSIPGLPDGQYKLEFRDDWYGDLYVDPVFSGQKSSIGSAAIITITNGSISTGNNVLLEIKAPSSAPTKVNLGDLSNDEKSVLENQVEAEKSSSGVKIKVGKEFAGEWVSAGIDSSSVRVSGLRIAALSGTDASAISTWIQVDSDGNVLVPESGNVAVGQKIVVQDAQNSVIGWTVIQAAGTVSNPSQTFTNESPAVLPKPLTAPVQGAPTIIEGKVKVGKTLTANAGKWSGNPTPKLSYQWFRCSKVKTSLSVKVQPKGCVAIKSATKTSYKLTKNDEKRYLLVRVTAKNSVSSIKSFSRSTGKTQVR